MIVLDPAHPLVAGWIAATSSYALAKRRSGAARRSREARARRALAAGRTPGKPGRPPMTERQAKDWIRARAQERRMFKREHRTRQESKP